MKKLPILFCLLSLISINTIADTLNMSADEVHSDTKKGIFTLIGSATVKSEKVTIHADMITIYRKEKQVVAKGNVHGKMASGSFSGEKMVYSTQKGTADISDGSILLNQGFIFRAKEIHYLGKGRYHLVEGSMTTCPDCCARWSFDASEIKVKKEGYAFFDNLTFRIGNHHYMYLPKFIYPAKMKRTFGLLIPEIGNSSRQGFKYRQSLFIPIGESMDMTYTLDYYSKAGTGNGFEYRLARHPGEFGRFYLYSISNNLKGGERSSLFDGKYHDFLPSGDKIRLTSFEGDDFNLVRDFTFRQYDLAMRQYNTDFSYEINRPHFQLTLAAARRNILFTDGKKTFYNLPELRFSSRGLTLAGHRVRLDARIGNVKNPNMGDSAFLSSFIRSEARRSFSLGNFTVTDRFRVSVHQYGNNPVLNDFSSYLGEIRLYSPMLEHHYGSSVHQIRFFTAFGYHNASSGFPEFINDSEDYITPDGIYGSAGVESILISGNRTAIGGMYITRNLSGNMYHNPNDSSRESKTSPIIAYLRFPFSDSIRFSLDARFDPALNTLDRMMFTANFGEHISASYLRAFTFGENQIRDSLIAAIQGQLSENWSAAFRADYDFTLNDFRYKMIQLRYYRDCIGMNITYRNNSYSTVTTNEFTISLVLRNIGEMFKYRLGL
ncbi:MAG: LPS-assembly protein LptD [Acidobacteria bacterium]|nr:LPS-assembly protein LptD [Acidobacteriota bacterium]